MRNKVVFYINKAADRYWGKSFLRQAWLNFAKRQLKDELQYTKGILNLNNLGMLFPAAVTTMRMGKRSRDFVYGYWTEEDICLKLALELSKFKMCQIHGQIHIHGTKNIKRSGYKPKDFHIHKYPDLFFISFKQKERSNYPREKNLESTAIEIKYFGAHRNKKDLKYSISRDLNKLIKYQIKRLLPKVDCGYFFCIDESGKAEDVLRALFKKRTYKRYPLGFGVLNPRYTLLGLQYPRFFERFNRGRERRIAYLLDCTMGKLKNTCLDKKGSLKKDGKYGFYFCLNKKPTGRVEIVWPKYIKGLSKKYLGTMLKFSAPYKKLLRGYAQYKWFGSEDRWIKTDKLTGKVLLNIKIDQSHLARLNKIERYANKIASTIRKLYNKYNR